MQELSKSFGDIYINKDKLIENFINVKNIANINLLVCYKKIFSKKGIKNNYGSYTVISIIFSHFFLIFLFYLNNFYIIIQNLITDIQFGI